MKTVYLDHNVIADLNKPEVLGKLEKSYNEYCYVISCHSIDEILKIGSTEKCKETANILNQLNVGYLTADKASGPYVHEDVDFLEGMEKSFELHKSNLKLKNERIEKIFKEGNVPNDDISIEKYRSIMGITPKQLGRSNPAEIFSALFKHSKNNSESKEYFENLIRKVQTYQTLDEKATYLNSILNYSGFASDKFHQEKTLASFTDGLHIGMGAYCEYFISGDKNLIKRAEAIYGFLNLATKAIRF